MWQKTEGKEDRGKNLRICKKKRARIETGDKCKRCKIGRIALVCCFIHSGFKDEEPYKSGVREGNCEEVHFSDSISVSINACNKCGEVYKKWFS